MFGWLVDWFVGWLVGRGLHLASLEKLVFSLTSSHSPIPIRLSPCTQHSHNITSKISMDLIVNHGSKIQLSPSVVLLGIKSLLFSLNFGSNNVDTNII
jgi:hypothetical protein